MPGLPLSLYEREEISHGLIADRDVSWAARGCAVGRHLTAITREVNTRGGREGYRPAVAQLCRLAEPECCGTRSLPNCALAVRRSRSGRTSSPTM